MDSEAVSGSRARSAWSKRAGEGLTIVASILLALAADSAWSYRSDRQEERRLLEGLREEFAEAASEVGGDIAYRGQMLDRIASAASYSAGPLPGDSLRVVVSALIDWRFYTPAHAVLDDAMASGRLDLIRSDSVRRAIMAYMQQRGRIGVFDERERDFVADRVEPVLMERLPLARILSGGGEPTDADIAAFRTLSSEPDFQSLVTLRHQRTEEAIIFSGLVQRTIERVRAALDDELGFASPDEACALPPADTVLSTPDGVVLLTWRLPPSEAWLGPELPESEAYQAFRTGIRALGADARLPEQAPPTPRTEEEARLWADEIANTELAYAGEVGLIEPIGCLDALLFAEQAERASPIERPAEFLASVLTREADGGDALAVTFGAGPEMFPPAEAYGADLVDRLRADGYRYAYALHNHTVRDDDGVVRLGVPVPSTSDVQLSLALGRDRGLEEVRVTNGFYTFRAPVTALSAFRSR